MKTIYLLRHAKSSWLDPELHDRDRPLSARGVRAIRALAGYLERERITPDLVLCSPARRARETLEAVRDAFPGAEALFDGDLYPGVPGRLVERVRALPRASRSVLIVGHNPALEDFAGLLLAAEGHDRSIKCMRWKYPTGALAILEAPIAWEAVVPGSCTLRAFVRPKDLE